MEDAILLSTLLNRGRHGTDGTCIFLPGVCVVSVHTCEVQMQAQKMKLFLFLSSALGFAFALR